MDRYRAAATSKLSVPPLVIGSDYSRHPIPGQQAMNLTTEASYPMTTIVFTSSDTFREHDLAACERATVPVQHYVEATYSALRTGPDGREIAHFVNDAWELPDGRRFSDWAVAVSA